MSQKTVLKARHYCWQGFSTVPYFAWLFEYQLSCIWLIHSDIQWPCKMNHIIQLVYSILIISRHEWQQATQCNPTHIENIHHCSCIESETFKFLWKETLHPRWRHVFFRFYSKTFYHTSPVALTDSITSMIFKMIYALMIWFLVMQYLVCLIKCILFGIELKYFWYQPVTIRNHK